MEREEYEGSLFEVLTMAKIFRRRRFFKEEEAAEIRKKAEVIDRKLHGLINSLRGRR
jgi:four helix bundle protein